jgi:hypothetical protein
VHERVGREQGGSRSGPSKVASGTAREQGIVPGRGLSPRSLLGLQRAVGNRTVVQRLLYNDMSGKVMGPEAYANKPLAWNEDRGFKEEGQPATPLKALVKQPNANDRLAKGFGVGWLTEIVGVQDNTLQNATAELLTKAQDGEEEAAKQARVGASNELQAVALHDRRLLEFSRGVKFGTVEQVKMAARWVFSPEDMLPNPPDLLPAGTDVLTAKVEGGTRNYWEYMCALIALFKATPTAAQKVKALTGKDCRGDLDKSVQALHDYYVGKNVQFDDSSERMAIMKDWGFNLVFSGDCAWLDLPAHIALNPKGVYIFETGDHAVYVKVKKSIPKGSPRVVDEELWFDPQSDDRNYTHRHEFMLNVLRIWQKS